MNTKINLVEILKNCPKGTELYSPLFGEVTLHKVSLSGEYPISVRTQTNDSAMFTKCGMYYMEYADSECMLFPSKDQRDWNKFKVNKSKFDPKTLKPFDKVLTKHVGHIWRCDLFSHYREKNGKITSYCTNEGYIYSYCIPYNEETKHLVGTTKEAPEFYRYWEF